MIKKLWRKPLDTEKVSIPKAKIIIMTDLCKGCGFCVEFCPKKVLEQSNQLNKRGVYPPKVGDINKCAVCGFCTAICPDFAIFATEENEADEEHE